MKLIKLVLKKYDYVQIRKSIQGGKNIEKTQANKHRNQGSNNIRFKRNNLKINKYLLPIELRRQWLKQTIKS